MVIDGLRSLSKLMLNSLYGKFATSLENKVKVPYLNEEGVVEYKIEEGNDKKGKKHGSYGIRIFNNILSALRGNCHQDFS